MKIIVVFSILVIWFGGSTSEVIASFGGSTSEVIARLESLLSDNPQLSIRESYTDNNIKIRYPEGWTVC